MSGWFRGVLRTQCVGQVSNFHMGYMEESDNRVAFMYRLVKGNAKRSFGLNVALLAKLPPDIVERAATMSKRLEAQVPTCENEPPGVYVLPST